MCAQVQQGPSASWLLLTPSVALTPAWFGTGPSSAQACSKVHLQTFPHTPSFQCKWQIPITPTYFPLLSSTTCTFPLRWRATAHTLPQPSLRLITSSKTLSYTIHVFSATSDRQARLPTAQDSSSTKLHGLLSSTSGNTLHRSISPVNIGLTLTLLVLLHTLSLSLSSY